MRIAIAQIAAIKGNIEKNIENHLKWICMLPQNSDRFKLDNNN